MKNYFSILFSSVLLVMVGTNFAMEETTAKESITGTKLKKMNTGKKLASFTINDGDDDSDKTASRESSDDKGIYYLSDDLVALNTIKKIMGQRLAGFDKEDKKQMKILAQDKIKEDPKRYRPLAALKATRSGKISAEAKENFDQLQTEVLKAYIESKKGEAAVATQNLALAQENAKKADEQVAWQRKFNTANFCFNICNAVATIGLSTGTFILGVYIATNTN